MKWNLPLALTVGRVLAIPAVLALFYLPFEHARQWACVLYGTACITDWLDGYLARKWNQTSKFGAFLDPVADKLMVAVCLVCLLHAVPVATSVALKGLLAAMVAVIIGREITVSALREWMAELGSRANVSVSWIGKVKTAFQMTAIGMMIWEIPTWGLPWYAMGYWLLAIAALLTLYSMAVYLRAAWPLMRESA
ncbi:MAG TPA: CDP-diacylglycerol--glycerol-3-phosphate 3-phosphatidyltransferase [Verrucomicrobiae bacterium]|nr:CDP-diacylglycerol--glycerol-3-phosphate 3-phosphatidyltransferase [Verrucomicrobiae bacterium]